MRCKQCRNRHRRSLKRRTLASTVTTTAHLDPTRPDQAEHALPARDRRAPVERVPSRVRRVALLVSPGLWVLGVVVLSFTLGARVRLAPLVEFGERGGTALAFVIVTVTSYLLARRRIRTQRAYDEVRRIADVTQRVLLRPVPERIGPVAAAVEYISAAGGARIGGDFYEIIETPYGVRAVLGDVRGNGLDAVSGAAALLGAFRE